MENAQNEIDKMKQNQMLKLVTHSFFRELMNYGVDTSDIVKVSVNLLDYVTKSKEKSPMGNGYYNSLFTLKDVQDEWQQQKRLAIKEVCIKPLQEDMLSALAGWLKAPEIENTFIRYFPKDEQQLKSYFFGNERLSYFGIFFRQHYVGIIGAENIDETFHKLEMKKFIGSREFRRKGIGKLATLLFLYYVFETLNFNKVYIHSLDTNIKNINLNSKFGFELEGMLYKEARVQDSYRDVLRMGLLKENWKKIFSAAGQ